MAKVRVTRARSPSRRPAVRVRRDRLARAIGGTRPGAGPLGSGISLPVPTPVVAGGTVRPPACSPYPGR